MLLQIHLHTTPYYILYKGEKLIYTENSSLYRFVISAELLLHRSKIYINISWGRIFPYLHEDVN